MLNSCKMVEKQSEAFHRFLWHFFPSLKHNLMHIVLPHVQTAFLKFTSCDNQALVDSCCSCSFKHEIIKIGQSSYNIYSNKILKFKEATTILNACTKKKSLETYWIHHVMIIIIMRWWWWWWWLIIVVLIISLSVVSLPVKPTPADMSIWDPVQDLSLHASWKQLPFANNINPVSGRQNWPSGCLDLMEGQLFRGKLQSYKSKLDFSFFFFFFFYLHRDKKNYTTHSSFSWVSVMMQIMMGYCYFIPLLLAEVPVYNGE